MSDAHGNFLAFKHTLDFLKKKRVDAIYFMGDALGYFPSIEVLDYLIANKKQIMSLVGNHELMYLNTEGLTEKSKKIYCYNQIRALIRPVHEQNIREWNKKVELNINGRSLLLVHGGPSDHMDQYVYEDTDVQFQADILVVGHTHRSFYRKTENNQIILNVGSCGLPRDDGRFSTCATVDTNEREVVIHRIETKSFHSETIKQFLPYIDPDVNRLFERRSFQQNRTHSIRMRF